MKQTGKLRYILKANHCDSKETFYSLVCITASCDEKVMLKQLTTDIEKGRMFCDFLNRNEVSPIHFETVFEDYFYC